MIFNEILHTYLGWCPRFNENIIRSTQNPLPYLSTIGKAVIVALLAAWGLNSLGSYQAILSYIDMINYIQLPQFTALFLGNIINIISGVVILVFLVDFIASKRVLRRHRIELSIFLVSQALFWFVAPFFDVEIYLSGFGGELLASVLFELIMFTFVALFFGYLAYRILSNKAVLGKNSFLLLSIVLAFWFVMTISPFGPYLSQDLLGWVSIGLRELVYGVAAIFCLSVYFKLRGSEGYEVDLPIVVRAVVFIYGFLSSGLFAFLATGNATFLYFNQDLSLLLRFVFYLGLMAVSFLPLRFKVGEYTPDIPELGP